MARKEAEKNDKSDDDSVKVKITGCEYKISEERLRSTLSYWGSITTDITEELFNDPHDTDGTNRTGIYTLRMIMDKGPPELIPVDGVRMKLQFRGVKKLCTGCYGEHLRKNCNEPKKKWTDYIKIFRESNPDIPDDFFGEFANRTVNKKSQESGPKPEDFGLPMNESEWEVMWSKMKECGINKEKAVEIMRERQDKYDKASKSFKEAESNKYCNE